MFKHDLAGDNVKKNLRFVIIPKVAHPWFEEVNKGALEQAELLEKQLGIKITIEYLPPVSADVVEQNSILEKIAETQPDGIAIDPLDSVGNMKMMSKIRDQGVPIIVFDSPSTEDGISSVGNDFTQQGVIAAERLVKLIGEKGKVAVMKGFPTAPNHKERYEAQIAVLQKYPDITIIDGGIDNDDIKTGYQQAATVLAKHHDLIGYLCCDASGPIGIAEAIKEAGKVGKVKVVGMDGIKPILEAIKEGVLDSSASTIPRMQGAMSILMLWQASIGVIIPKMIDTGIDVITRDNVDDFIALS
ncbi:MAG: sugar ABC transporter substrate-binding protein [Actinobacteria bacterium]|nr:sugar ABC transporter substrate-binding protein [Actinomycetota bacterium]